MILYSTVLVLTTILLYGSIATFVSTRRKLLYLSQLDYDALESLSSSYEVWYCFINDKYILYLDCNPYDTGHVGPQYQQEHVRIHLPRSDHGSHKYIRFPSKLDKIVYQCNPGYHKLGLPQLPDIKIACVGGNTIKLNKLNCYHMICTEFLYKHKYIKSDGEDISIDIGAYFNKYSHLHLHKSGSIPYSFALIGRTLRIFDGEPRSGTYPLSDAIVNLLHGYVVAVQYYPDTYIGIDVTHIQNHVLPSLDIDDCLIMTSVSSSE